MTGTDVAAGVGASVCVGACVGIDVEVGVGVGSEPQALSRRAATKADEQEITRDCIGLDPSSRSF